MRLIIGIFSVSLLYASPKESVQNFFDKTISAYQKEQWDQVIESANKIVKEHKSSTLAKEVFFYLGVAHFHTGDYDLANRYLSKYLKKSPSPKFFEQVMQYKLEIAEEFRHGAKKHIFSWEKSPTWTPAREDAFEIYDEIIHTIPHGDLAAKALFGKALLQGYYKDYKESIDTLQTLIRKFPSHELVPDAYLEIQYLFLDLCEQENLDPNILDHAYVNFRRFKESFPGEDRISVAEEILQSIKEAFAHNFYETGLFYERTHKQEAAIIYYAKIISKFPDTETARKAQKRLDQLQATP